MATKTNINLIVNGAKVYTRKTTGRPYTHALVERNSKGAWVIVSCSSKGTQQLQNIIDDGQKTVIGLTFRIANEPGSPYVATWEKTIYDIHNANSRILPIIDNTVTLNA
jgi:hypothetical protein